MYLTAQLIQKHSNLTTRPESPVYLTVTGRAMAVHQRKWTRSGSGLSVKTPTTATATVTSIHPERARPRPALPCVVAGAANPN